MRMCVWLIRKKKMSPSSVILYPEKLWNLPNVHIDLFLNLALWCVPLPGFTLRHHRTFLYHMLPQFPCTCSFKLLYEAMPQWVVFQCTWQGGLQYRTFDVCWHKTVFLTCDHVISLNLRRNSFKRDTCIFCKVENLIPIITHM